MKPRAVPDAPAIRTSVREELSAEDLLSKVLGALVLKERLGLEYDKVMILALVAANHIARSTPRAEDAVGGAKTGSGLLSWNGSTMSLARRLGMPRETVRRKLVELSEDGWLVADGNNGRYRPARHLLEAMRDSLPEQHAPA